KLRMPMRRLDRPSLPVNSCARADPHSPMSVCSYMLGSPSLSRLIGIRETLVRALRPSPSARRPSLHLENGKRVTLHFVGGNCVLLGDSCGLIQRVPSNRPLYLTAATSRLFRVQAPQPPQQVSGGVRRDAGDGSGAEAIGRIEAQDIDPPPYGRN